MFRIIACPQCKMKFKGKPRSLKQWFSGKRQCVHCGAWVERANKVILGVLLGLLLPCFFWVEDLIENPWIAQLLMPVPCGIVLLTIVDAFGRWRFLPSGPVDSKRVKKWSRIVGVSVVAGILGILGMLFNFKFLILALNRLDTGSEDFMEMMTQLVNATIFRMKVFAGVLAIALIVMCFASIMKNRTRKAELTCVSPTDVA